MADEYLPTTGADFGRAGKLRSHRLYHVTAPVETQQHRLPKAKGESGEGKMIVELRSTGAQTVFPPSIHDSGERIEWHTAGEPASSDPAELSARLARLADAVRDKLGVTTTPPRNNGHTPAAAILERAKIINRAEKYVAKMPPAIQGSNGSGAALHVACELFRFGLTDAEARDLFDQFNSRCLPPWSANEIEHKLTDAREKVTAAGEFGSRLKNDGGGRNRRRTASRAKEGGQSQPDDRAVVCLSTNEADINESVIRALARDDKLFQRAGRLVHVVASQNHDGIGRPEHALRILTIQSAGLRERLTQVVRFISIDHEGKPKPAHPPKWCYEAIAARGQWAGLRSLAGVVTAPVLRPDGPVLNAGGYDPQTGLLFDPEGVSFPIIEHPSHGDAVRATASLLDVVADFPFTKPDHRAAWLAFLLTALGRFAFWGPAPLFLVDANIRGSGKSLLCDVVSLIVTGREMSRMSNPKDDDEARKRITALALAGDTLCLIDNIIGGLGCASLDAALTGTVWKDRVLGASEIVELPLSVTWAATGNNVMLHADTTRRVVHIRLDSPLENPEEREGFRHPNLKAYVRQHRPKLLADALTILAAFCRAGRPQRKLPPWGSFEGWSDLVRQAVVWCGQPDPGATRTELVEQSDREATALRELLAGWDELDPDRFGLTTSEILHRLFLHQDQYEQIRGAVLELCPAPADKLPSVRSLGNKLRHLRGRMIGGRCLNYREGRGRKRAWHVVTAQSSSGDSGDSGDSVSAAPHTRAQSLYEKWPATESPEASESPQP